MLNAERGDCASVAKIIEQQAALTEQGQQAVRDTSQDSLGGCGGPSNCDNMQQLSSLDINCTDPLGRTALSIAIINENPELMEILLEAGIQTRDSLLLAIDEQVGGAQLYSQT